MSQFAKEPAPGVDKPLRPRGQNPAKGLMGVVIAASHSGCGKTSVALGLMRALCQRGIPVQAFKVGPDFIDPGLHALATGRPSHNLDAWMLSPAKVSEIFARASADAAVAIVEGAMGLFDGHGASSRGSTAEIAHILGLPVLLVVDARAMGNSIAALVQGFARFQPGLRLWGVVANQVGSARHAAILRQAMGAVPGITVAGILPRNPTITMPHRHLGLMTAQDLPQAGALLTALADWVEEAGVVDAILALPPMPRPALPEPSHGQNSPCSPTEASAHRTSTPECLLPQAGAEVRIGIAQDPAFCFYYAENLRLLEAAGARIVPFSPLADPQLPPGIHGLYLGGGYPEVHAASLAANASLRHEIHAFCASGRPVWAECGGMLYLLEELVDSHGMGFPMVGYFALRGVMEKQRQALGYREVTLAHTCPLGKSGDKARGHEFHYSRMVGHDSKASPLFTSEEGDIGLLHKGCMASYVHLHLGSCPHLASAFVRACRQHRPWTPQHHAASPDSSHDEA